MKKTYLTYDPINGEYETHETIEEARKYLESMFIDAVDGSYHPDTDRCKIYKLEEVVEIEVTDRKSNYKYEYDEEIPEGDEESEAWPYPNEFDEIWKHHFTKVEDKNWIPVTEKLPKHLQTVWLKNDKGWVTLGCLVEDEDQFENEYNYHWAESNGVIYQEGGEIVSECESDDLDVTHWCALPKV